MLFLIRTLTQNLCLKHLYMNHIEVQDFFEYILRSFGLELIVFLRSHQIQVH